MRSSSLLHLGVEARGPTPPGFPRLNAVRLAAALVAVVLASGPLAAIAPARAQSADERRVGVSVLGFSPQRIEIRTGTTVVWANENLFDYPIVGGTHEVVADAGTFASPPIAPGASWAFEFLRPGTYAYADPRHPNLTGEVVATGPAIEPPALEQSVDIVEPSATTPDTWTYRPADVVVQTGTTVTWRNTGGQLHTVTADDDSFDSGDMAAGATWSRTFDAPGVFLYHCEPHPWMTAAVRVAAPGAEPPPPAPPSSGGSSPPVTIDVPQPSGSDDGPQTWQARIVEPDVSKPKSWTFVPQQLAIKPGDTVRWQNAGKIEHTVTADDGSFDSGSLLASEDYERTFTSTGVFRYSCTPHPWMTGAVVVTERPATVKDLQVGADPDAPTALGPPPDGGSGSGAPDLGAVADVASSVPVALAVEALLLAAAAGWVTYVARSSPA